MALESLQEHTNRFSIEIENYNKLLHTRLRISAPKILAVVSSALNAIYSLSPAFLIVAHVSHPLCDDQPIMEHIISEDRFHPDILRTQSTNDSTGAFFRMISYRDGVLGWHKSM